MRAQGRDAQALWPLLMMGRESPHLLLMLCDGSVCSLPCSALSRSSVATWVTAPYGK